MITKIEMTGRSGPQSERCRLSDAVSMDRLPLWPRYRCRIGQIVFPFARFGWVVGWAALAMSFDRKLLASIQRTWNESPVLETLRNDCAACLRFRPAECHVDGFAQTRRARSASPVERGPRRRTLRGAGRLPTLRSWRNRGRTIFLLGRSLCRRA